VNISVVKTYFCSFAAECYNQLRLMEVKT